MCFFFYCELLHQSDQVAFYICSSFLFDILDCANLNLIQKNQIPNMSGLNNLNNTIWKSLTGGIVCGVGAFAGGLIGGPIGIGVGSVVGCTISASIFS